MLISIRHTDSRGEGQGQSMLDSTSKMCKLFALSLLFVFLAVSSLQASVYSIDPNIDVNRMAVHKLYYDLYYNPATKLFERTDLVPLSPTAIALVQGATDAKIDRGEGARQADKAEYSEKTGENNCSGDPYIGSGTDVLPEIQSLTNPKPSCLEGGANYADENMGYVFMVDKAVKTLNAKTAELESFRADSFVNPVPRVAQAPSADRTRYMDQWIVHDDGTIVWDGGVPAGFLPPGCKKTDGSSCFLYVKDGNVPASVDFAVWTDHATIAGPLISVDPSRLRILRADIAVYVQPDQDVSWRRYSFLINNYTVTKNNVLFCEVGWDSPKNISIMLPYTTDQLDGPWCGGSYDCMTSPPEDCLDWDYTLQPPVCKTSTYHCRGTNVCMHTDYSCGQVATGPLTIKNLPVTVDITLPGSDTSLEPENLPNNLGLVYSEAQSQLPSLIKVDNILIGSVVRCDGTSLSPTNCKDK